MGFGVDDILTREKGMSSIAKKSESVVGPRWENIHIQQLPCLEGVWAGFAEELQQGRIEILVYTQ